MDPITDNALLLVRMRELFPPAMSLPGVDMEICDVDGQVLAGQPQGQQQHEGR